ncbi:MAG: hypothetical protein ACI4WH_08545 [Oscillospiraceae bacterium]
MKSILTALGHMGENIVKGGFKLILAYVISLVIVIIGVFIPVLQIVVVISALVTGWRFITSITYVFISFNPLIIAVKFLASCLLGVFVLLPLKLAKSVLHQQDIDEQTEDDN